MSTSYPPQYAYPSAPPLRRALPSPPRLHWGWVLVLSIVTFGIFGTVWLLVQANWIRRMREGKSTGFWLALANLGLLPAVFFYALIVAIAARMYPSGSAAAVLHSLGPMARILSYVLYLFAVFTMRSEMEREPIGIPLGWVMTALFAPLYFQYHLRDFGGAYAPEGTGLGLGAAAASVRGPAAEDAVYPPPPTEPLPPFGPNA